MSKWELVADKNTFRLKVEGGYLYKVYTYSGRVALTFVPHRVEVTSDG